MKWLIYLGFLILVGCDSDSASRPGSGVDGPRSEANAEGDGPEEQQEEKSGQPETISDDGTTVLNADNIQDISQSSFKLTLYPKVTKHCSGCHADSVSPFFASGDANAAHDVLIESAKIDFKDPAASRLAQRLNPENHNCWSGDCAADADEIVAAITEWARALEEAGADPSEAELATETTRILFQDAEESTAVADPSSMVMLAASYATLSEPFTMMDDDVDGEATTYLVSNEGGNRDPALDGAEATYTFEVSVPGTYAVWGRIKALTGGNNSFYVKMDDGPFLAWGTVVTMDEWMWNRANQDNGQTELLFNLTAGTHTVTIKQREQGTRINQIALTDQLEGFEGGPVAGNLKELRFPLDGLTGKAASLVVDVRLWDEETNTVLMKNLRIETEDSIQIKDVMPLINGKWSPQHATWRIVDETIAAPGGALSDAAMIVVGENGWDDDELSFAFEIAE